LINAFFVVEILRCQFESFKLAKASRITLNSLIASIEPMYINFVISLDDTICSFNKSGSRPVKIGKDSVLILE